ncbi:NAD-dependent succinate-semialdehyde dehydrogenase [Granulosicoccaceae sp. 1_MG-2023]|nr:NAD-dependent succinate-semialdehyde dehydrogenase [Granulosicoccaceae sp. 1_MG-2023]
MTSLNLQHASLWQTRAHIRGRWLDGDNGFFDVTDPAGGGLVARVAELSPAQVRSAVDAAAEAQPAWAALSADARADFLQAWYAKVKEHREDLARLMTLEQGKPLGEARAEIDYAASYIRWYAEEARRIVGELISLPQNDRAGLVSYTPVGVVAAITPWNFPSAMITRKVAPALAAGCSVVLKPAAETPLSALALMALAEECGIAPGVINVVTGTDAPAIGEVLTGDPRVRKLSFTGSTRVGKALMRACTDTMKRTSMELGGNAPLIVLDDADLDLAVAGTLASKFRNAGQTCICANRLLVHEAVYERFLDKLVAAVSGMTPGSGFDEQTTLGPLIHRRALESVQAKVQDALAQGARLLTGGQAIEGQGCFFQPTVLADVNVSMQVFREEIFGPVAPVTRFACDREAVALANDTPFGLAAYVFGKDTGRLWQISQSLAYGMVGVNETAISSAQIPFGGVKESGHGREGARQGLMDYLDTRYTCLGNLIGQGA